MLTHKLHNHLSNKLNWYNRYHQWEHHHKLHWAVLAMYVLSVVSFGFASVTDAPRAQAVDPEISATLISGTMPERVSSGPGGPGDTAEAIYDFGELHTVTSYSVTLECSGSGGLQAKAYLYLSTDNVDYSLIKSSTGCASLDGTTNTSARYAKWKIEINLPTFWGPGFIDLSSPHLFEPAADPPPTISISSPSNNCVGDKHYTRSSDLTVSGTASDTAPGTISSVTVNGSAATGTTSWSKSGVPLNSGDNTITAVATDNSAQTASASITVNRDSTAPSVTISSPAEGTVTSSSTATVSGSASDNSGGSGLTSVTSSSGSSVSGTSNWSTTVNLSAGTNTIILTATDCAGNQANQSVGIVYQTGTGGGTDTDQDTVKSITVTAPNGGENYLIGSGSGALSSSNITWTTENISASEKIKLSYTTNNSSYTTIADNESNDGSYPWALPQTKSSSVKVKAELTTDATVLDTSDATFTLHSNSSPEIRI